MLKKLDQIPMSYVLFALMELVLLIALPFSANTFSQNAVLVPLCTLCFWCGSEIALG